MRARLALSAVVTGGLLLSGCGEAPVEAADPTSAADAVPALAASLERVDAALVARRAEEARTALATLVGLTEEARDAGELGAEEAAAILAAAAQVADRLPSPQPSEAADTATETTTTTTRPTRTATMKAPARPKAERPTKVKPGKGAGAAKKSAAKAPGKRPGRKG